MRTCARAMRTCARACMWHRKLHLMRAGESSHTPYCSLTPSSFQDIFAAESTHCILLDADAAHQGEWQHCKDVAFPHGEELVKVLADEESDPQRRAIRVAAAQGLGDIVAKYQIQEAAKAIADNYTTFFDLCGTLFWLFTSGNGTT
jgi:hypothetical protein